MSSKIELPEVEIAAFAEALPFWLRTAGRISAPRAILICLWNSSQEHRWAS